MWERNGAVLAGSLRSADRGDPWLEQRYQGD
jgi:hypothetical protein